MNLKKLTDQNHLLQAAFQRGDLCDIQNELLKMMVIANELRKEQHLNWERNNQPKASHARPRF
jgi:hypothetical protein